MNWKYIAGSLLLLRLLRSCSPPAQPRKEQEDQIHKAQVNFKDPEWSPLINWLLQVTRNIPHSALGRVQVRYHPTDGYIYFHYEVDGYIRLKGFGNERAPIHHIVMFAPPLSSFAYERSVPAEYADKLTRKVREPYRNIPRPQVNPRRSSSIHESQAHHNQPRTEIGFIYPYRVFYHGDTVVWAYWFEASAPICMGIMDNFLSFTAPDFWNRFLYLATVFITSDAFVMPPPESNRQRPNRPHRWWSIWNYWNDLDEIANHLPIGSYVVWIRDPNPNNPEIGRVKKLFLNRQGEPYAVVEWPSNRMPLQTNRTEFPVDSLKFVLYAPNGKIYSVRNFRRRGVLRGFGNSRGTLRVRWTDTGQEEDVPPSEIAPLPDNIMQI